VRRQLEAIRSLAVALEAAGIAYWLFGGWAVDFWVGRVTRPHDDVDVAVRRVDQGRVDEALRAAGWTHTPRADDRLGTRYGLRGAELELTFVEEDHLGRVVVPLPDAPVVWYEGPLRGTRRELLGVTCQTIPLPVLRAGKRGARASAVEAAKDAADLEALSRVVAT
jgi:hypothetical protein